MAEGEGRGPVGPVEEGFGNRPGNIRSGFGRSLFGRDRQARQAEARRLWRRRMFLGMIEGLFGVVVVDGPVVLMVMVDALVVFEPVHERGRAGDGRQAALHGETIQGQAEQQEYMDNPAQKVHQSMWRDYSRLGPGRCGADATVAHAPARHFNALASRGAARAGARCHNGRVE